MKMTRSINDPYHNPFHNRFHFPVHSRIDEMQAYTHMTWLNEPVAQTEKTQNQNPLNWVRGLAPAFAFALIMLVSALSLL